MKKKRKKVLTRVQGCGIIVKPSRETEKNLDKASRKLYNVKAVPKKEKKKVLDKRTRV